MDESRIQTSRLVHGRTPHGGAYAVFYYRGAQPGSRATPVDAVGVEVVEYNLDGDEVFRTYMSRNVVPELVS